MFGESLLEKALSQAHLKVNPGLCLRLRHKKSSCRLCLEHCPRGAISIDESVNIESSRCHGCGICINVCPTGVFEFRYLTYESLLEQLKERTTVEFVCSQLPQVEGTLEVSCLGYLNEAVLTGAIASGIHSVELNMGQCDQCDFTFGQHVATQSLRRANQTLSLFSISRKVSATVGERNYILREHGVYSRREFFSRLGKDMRSRLATVVENINDDRETAARTKVLLEPGLPKKRILLLEQIKKLGPPVATRVSAENLPFAEVEISANCTACGMCVTFCPTGALSVSDEADKQVIAFSTAYCLACKLCADICPENAITYSANVEPRDLVAGGRKILVEHGKSTCVRCGQSYIAVPGNSWCLTCRKQEVRGWLARTR